ncbi:ferredoxin [Streptomyces sp. NPDC048349]|uniref:ferredoxin n=1 Tax=Streptomyces sp. NPDC048349 TaxID=3155486 RepID=UPI00343468D4
MRITADTGKCIGAGQCLFTEPDLFDQNETDGRVVVLNAEPEGEILEQKAREAVYLCPSRALSLAE